MSRGTYPLACLSGAYVLSVFHYHLSHNRNVLYVTIIIKRRTMIVKGLSNACPWSMVLVDGWRSRQLRGVFVRIAVCVTITEEFGLACALATKHKQAVIL